MPQALPPAARPATTPARGWPGPQHAPRAVPQPHLRRPPQAPRPWPGRPGSAACLTVPFCRGEPGARGDSRQGALRPPPRAGLLEPRAGPLTVAGDHGGQAGDRRLRLGRNRGRHRSARRREADGDGRGPGPAPPRPAPAGPALATHRPRPRPAALTPGGPALSRWLRSARRPHPRVEEAAPGPGWAACVPSRRRGRRG